MIDEPRIDLPTTTPDVYSAMRALEEAVTAEAEAVGLEPEIRELVKIRASQLNGCAFCLDMHTADARKFGVGDQRIDLLPAWREASPYSARERAALELAEAITLVRDGHVSDEVWARAREVFPERELAVLTWAVATINTWNRLMVSVRRPAPQR